MYYCNACYQSIITRVKEPLVHSAGVGENNRY